MIKLGQQAKDKITGFKGILVARCQYITGCDQYAISPKSKNHDVLYSQFFDESRIEITGKGIEIKEVYNEKLPGGPNRDAPRK